MFIFDILCKTFIQAKPLRIWFNKIDGFIKIYDEITYLVLFDYEKYNGFFDRINYLPNCKKH